QHARHRHDQRQDQQESTGRRHRVEDRSRMRHQASLVASPTAGEASTCSVAEPVAWNSRSSSATAMAVAEKAPTMPGMTTAGGPVSAPTPAAAPVRATTPKNTNAPLPSRLKPSILRSG